MITNWKLRNFKSINQTANLDLAPLTIFCGANSSGKSTLLQSILLIAQTLAHKFNSPSVVLNGTMVKLGRLDELRNNQDTSTLCEISWMCRHPTLPKHLNTRNESRQRPFGPSPIYRRKNSVRYACDISIEATDFSTQQEINQIQPALALAKISTHPNGQQETSRHLTVERLHDHQTYEQEKATYIQESGEVAADDDTLLDGLLYRPTLDEFSSTEYRDSENSKLVGCILHHFLPNNLILEVDKVAMDTHLIGTLTERRGYFRPSHYRYTDVEIPNEIIQLIYSADRNIQNHTDSNTPTLEHSVRSMDTPPVMLAQIQQQVFRRGQDYRDKMVQELEKATSRPGSGSGRSGFEAKVFKALKSLRQDEEPWLNYSVLPREIADACMYFGDFFSGRVKYLGPLRDDPKVLHPFSATADPTEIGLKGEYTAAVLELHKGKNVRYLSPSAISTVTSELELTNSPLSEAVSVWLRYLGIAQSVNIKIRGQLGHELSVQTPATESWHDLTKVGVGVSQVLPILVMGLLADFDTTMIFEQPELHLHPRVQSLLADFFLSLTRIGKQCLIETHSEHLVNHLRLRMVDNPNSGTIKDSIKIYFAEKDEQGTKFRSIQINEFGAIEDWPDGFFDQSQIEAREILAAAVRKRRQEKIHANS